MVCFLRGTRVGNKGSLCTGLHFSGAMLGACGDRHDGTPVRKEGTALPHVMSQMGIDYSTVTVHHDGTWKDPLLS
jgi:hypothetical protein